MKTGQFCFENIGQGLFYQGRLQRAKACFDFVYDCGSISVAHYLHTAIDRYRLGITKLEMLVISHFDEDHVNGIVRLINGRRVDRLILPYVSWVERLVVFHTSASNDGEYLRMLRDPLVFFGSDEFDIGEIIVVGGPDQPPVNNPNFNLPGPPDQGKETDDNEELTVTPAGDRMTGIGGIEAFLQTLATGWGAARPRSTTLTLYKSPFSVFVGGWWEFHFYNVECKNAAKLEAFQKELESWMSIHGLKAIDLFDDAHRETVRKIYTKHYGSLNQTSLVMYHNALPAQKAMAFVPYPHGRFHHAHAVESSAANGTLLTGDLDISTIAKLNDLLAFYKSKLHRVGIFLVPHHAANRNWHFRHPSGLENFEAYVVSAGVKRKNHPSAKVLDDIDANCTGDTFHANESIQYWYDVLLF